MKKTILKVLLWLAEAAGSFGIGWFFGTIANWLLGKIVDEEFAEKHPTITILLWALSIVVATGAAILVVTYPLNWVAEWFSNKIDSIEDDSEEWDR